MGNKNPNHIIKHQLATKRDLRTINGLIVIGLLLTGIFAWRWFSPAHIPTNFAGILHVFDFILFALVTYVVWHQITNELFYWYICRHMTVVEPMKLQEGMKVAFLTAFVPGKEPFDVLEKTLKAMIGADYPHDTWLLDEGDNPTAKELCRRYGVFHFTRNGRDKYNQKEGPFKTRTKAGNYNAWFHRHSHRYDIVAQLDVDFVPKKDFLTKTLGYFQDPAVGFVGAPQIYGNQASSWIARGAAEQAFCFYGVTQRGLFGKDMLLLIGSNHVMRVLAHTAIDGYSGHIVEDHLTGMRLYAGKWKSVYVPEVLAVGEGPSTWGSYFNQQMRWAYGLIDILFRESPHIFPKMRARHAMQYLFLQQYYFHGLAQGIGVILLMLYFFFGIQATPMQLPPLLMTYIPVIAIQLAIFFYLQKYYINPNDESEWSWRGKYLSLAAWPVYLIAFVCVLFGKRLTYTVTPKGSAQEKDVQLSLFIPHAVLGTLTTLAIVAAFMTGKHTLQLLFLAALNSVIMYSFVLKVVWEKIKSLKTNKKLISRSLLAPIFRR